MYKLFLPAVLLSAALNTSAAEQLLVCETTNPGVAMTLKLVTAEGVQPKVYSHTRGGWRPTCETAGIERQGEEFRKAEVQLDGSKYLCMVKHYQTYPKVISHYESEISFSGGDRQTRVWLGPDKSGTPIVKNYKCEVR